MTGRGSAEPSGAVSARYDAACPTCGAAGIGSPCRTKTSDRVTDAHLARRLAQVTSGGRLPHQIESEVSQ